MKRTRAQIRRSLNELATDLTVSGHRGYAKRLRRYTTELLGLAEIPKNKPREKSARRGISEHDLCEAMLSGDI